MLFLLHIVDILTDYAYIITVPFYSGVLRVFTVLFILIAPGLVAFKIGRSGNCRFWLDYFIGWRLKAATNLPKLMDA